MSLARNAVVSLVQPLPAAAAIGPLRRRFLRRLSGIGDPGHVALTFDDGPDRRSTPQFLRLLRARGVRATFFLLGGMARGNAEVAEAIVAEGHEIALHGYQHRCLLLRGPVATYEDLARGKDAVARATGVVPRWWRPPYGVLSAAALAAASRLELTPVLWTAWGRDWSAKASPASVHRIVTKDLRSGGTVLLHDSDCTSAPGSWRNTLAALPGLLDHCASNGWRVGPLGEHAVPGAPALAGIGSGVAA